MNLKFWHKFWHKKKQFKTSLFVHVFNKNMEMLTNTDMREAIKELFKDNSTKKIGNFYFSKKEMFNINPLDEIPIYVGFMKDGSLIAIYCFRKISKNSYSTYLKNLITFLQDPKLEGKTIKYVGLEEDRKCNYLAVKLWDYNLDEYIRNLQPHLRTIVTEILLGLQVLHRAGVIHRDINPENILIVSKNHVRLTGFGRSLKLEEEGETTDNTDGTQDLDETEDLARENKYAMSLDITAAGMLVYYIHSGGKYPFGVIGYCDMERDVKDTVARDLIDWMITNAPAIDEALKHPYFWNKKRKEEVIRKLGDRPEVQNYIDILKVCETKKAEEGLIPREVVGRTFSRPNKKDTDSKTKILGMLGMLGNTEEVQNKILDYFSNLCNYAEKYTQGKTFRKWKSVLSDTDKYLPEDILGLLRTYRNKLAHGGFDIQKFTHFPDFYISLHRLAIEVGWDCSWS